MFSPTPSEEAQRDAVVAVVLAAIRDGVTIRLPAFDPAISRASDQFALVSVGLEPNAFGGTVGEFRYQFEGEEDLLHLIVTHLSGEPVAVKDAQTVAHFLLPEVPPALIWLRPGEFSQHFYIGHDVLLEPSATDTDYPPAPTDS